MDAFPFGPRGPPNMGPQDTRGPMMRMMSMMTMPTPAPNGAPAMAAADGAAAPPSWLITTALCVALSALVFLLLKVTSKCLLPIAAVLLTASILAVLTLVTMGVTQVYAMIGTNSTSPVEVFRATCSTMPLVGGELILVVTSACAFSIGIGCMLCIFAGAKRGQHVWAESSPGLGGIGAMATLCVIGVPFAMIGIAVASAVVVIRCAPPPNSTMADGNTTWPFIPDWPQVPFRQSAPWPNTQSRYTQTWDSGNIESVPPSAHARSTMFGQRSDRGPPSFEPPQDSGMPQDMPQLPEPPPPPPQMPQSRPQSGSPRMRRPSPATSLPPQPPPPAPEPVRDPFAAFHHHVHHDETEPDHRRHDLQLNDIPSRMASTRLETKSRYESRNRQSDKDIQLLPSPTSPSEQALLGTATTPPTTAKRIFTGNATMSKVIKIKTRNGTVITIS